MTNLDAVSDRIRAEYLEMPGMRLTFDQVARLCGIERSVCQEVLQLLVEAQFLALKPDGVYARRSEEIRRMRMANAQLQGYLRPQVSRRALRSL